MARRQTYEVRFENAERLSGVLVVVEATTPERAIALARTEGNVPDNFEAVSIATVARKEVVLPPQPPLDPEPAPVPEAATDDDTGEV